jgi:hypothetical protein
VGFIPKGQQLALVDETDGLYRNVGKPTLRNNAEERISHLHRGERLKSRNGETARANNVIGK